MSNESKFALGIAILALLVAGVAMFKVAQPVFGGNTAYDKQSLFAGFFAGNSRQMEVDLDGDLVTEGSARVAEFTQGGGVLDVTDANGGTITLTQANLASSNVLKMTASGAGQEVIALTLPATSTLTTLLPNAGDMREWIIDASALAAATTTTVTAGTGIDLIAVTTNDDVIDGLEFARLTCWRQADTDVSCITSELLHAD